MTILRPVEGDSNRLIPAADYNLSGLIDIHIHSAPDVVPRQADDIETVRDTEEAGTRAVLLKSHVTLTADRAVIAQRSVRRLRVFGGLALNAPVGGLNPAAVEVALKLGAKQIWMPTRGTANEHRQEGLPGGLSIFDENGRIYDAIHEILDLISAADVILATGSLSVEESVALVRLARERGLRKIVVTHPEAPFIRMPVAVQHELRRAGAFFERCYVFTTPCTGSTVTALQIAEQIREVGVDSTVLSTDFGQAANVPPVEGLRAYLAAMQVEGLSHREIRRMAADNPAALLNLPRE